MSYDKFNILPKIFTGSRRISFIPVNFIMSQLHLIPVVQYGRKKFLEIKEQTRIVRLPRILFRHEDNAFFENSIVAADSGYLKCLHYLY